MKAPTGCFMCSGLAKGKWPIHQPEHYTRAAGVGILPEMLGPISHESISSPAGLSARARK